MENLVCGFIGLGLIGGSIAKALRSNMKAVQILVYDISVETLHAALSDKTADQAVSQIDERFLECDYLFLCGPVQENAKNLKKVLPFLSKKTILTDVGSVKSDIHACVEELGLSHQFIGGHPMAGSERYGYQSSKARLLENAYYILTPSPLVPKDKVSAFRDLVAGMGAIPLLLSPGEHDYVTAAISHLPHIIAASLVNLIEASDSSEGIMKAIAAGGFKDITRIASSSPFMWQQICLVNGENISRLLEDYIESLFQIKELLEQKNSPGLLSFFEHARTYRDSLSDASGGPIKISYTLNVDIADEPGALASIATLLAQNEISIKNIGIRHNREQEEGVLRIEFHEENAFMHGAEILRNTGYSLSAPIPLYRPDTQK